MLKKTLCILLLITPHFVVGMKKIVEDEKHNTVFSNKKGETYRFTNLNPYTVSGKKELISSIVDNKITKVHITVKDYFELLKKMDESTIYEENLPLLRKTKKRAQKQTEEKNELKKQQEDPFSYFHQLAEDKGPSLKETLWCVSAVFCGCLYLMNLIGRPPQ